MMLRIFATSLSVNFGGVAKVLSTVATAPMIVSSMTSADSELLIVPR